jgi:hypothetical protein
VRLELNASPSTGWWVLTCSRWDEAGKQWRPAFQGKLAGLMKDADRMQRHREQFKVYYVFDGTAPGSVRTFVEKGSATLECRLTRGDSWMDFRAQIMADTPFILFSSPRQSDDGLVAHCSQAFADMMTYLAVDVPGAPGEGGEMAAREHRGEYVTVQFQQYAAAYRPGVNRQYFIFWPAAPTAPGEEPRRVMFSPGGFQSAWLDCPYVLYAGEFKGNLDVTAARHLATALHLRATHLMTQGGGR